jgi:hypothetical protein
MGQLLVVAGCARIYIAIHDAQCIIKSASEFPAVRGKNLCRTSRIQLPACADGVGVNQSSPATLEVDNPSLRCQRLETIQKLQHSQEVSGQHFRI